MSAFRGFNSEFQILGLFLGILLCENLSFAAFSNTALSYAYSNDEGEANGIDFLHLMEGRGAFCDLDGAVKVFDEMPVRPLSCWNKILHRFVARKMVGRVLGLFG
ncbi:hypothetical protein JHK85_046152 [Glycine max]|nr:hypothetical protein JHK85_046152 [Glycine max]